MAVLLWGAAAAVVGAIAHDDHSAYSDYDDYDNYSNYSDYAERQRKRLAGLKSDTESAARELSNYKSYTVNPELSSQTLKAQSAMRIDNNDMDKDAKQKISRQVEHDEVVETSSLQKELDLVDDLLKKISDVERQN